MNRTTLAALSLGTLTIVLAICGCGHRSAPQGNRVAAKHDALFAVKVDKTAFYEFGPMQARGPDRQLSRDTLVTLIRRSFGYSKVRLEDGQVGFVANDDVDRAPERLIAQTRSDADDLPPPPPVSLPTSPDVEPTPLPQPLMPQ
jgi:hypothetical protein